MAKISRRKFLWGGALACAAIPLAAANIDNLSDVILEELLVRVPNLPREFENYRLGFITDTHSGVCVSDAGIERSIELLNVARIDFLALGGDFIWNTESLIPQVALSAVRGSACFVSNLEHCDAIYSSLAGQLGRVRAPDGMAAVLGNHDRWVSPDSCQKNFEAARIPVLVNREITILRGQSRLRIYGADDYWTGIPKPPRTWDEARQREARILLAHNPDYLSELMFRSNTKFDLGLSGHTHGGQIKLPLLGAPFYNVQDLRLAEGLYTHSGTTTYTSRGIGVVGVPLRVNCPPEVTVIELRGA